MVRFRRGIPGMGWAAGRALRVAALLGLAVLHAACAGLGREPAGPDVVAELGLPPGPGAATLARACTGCHNLEGLWAYQGYYNEQRWRSLVESMIAHGAQLNETESNDVVAYLVLRFGPGTRTAAGSNARQ
jgi:hypothetical protein